MNTTWLRLPTEKRIRTLNQVTEVTGLPEIAIEKDWWVTLALNACFSLSYSEHLIFKGGTSLSKGWNLIERFSEDIDLAIDRKFFGFEGDMSKTQVKKLRKQSCEFISNTFLQNLTKKLTEWNAINQCKLIAQPIKNSDKDPQTIEIHYNSVSDSSEYLPQRVLIEISSRSLMEPIKGVEINSILGTNFPRQKFASDSINISTVLPQRTFLKKIFLFTIVLYHTEKKINAIKGLDYSNHVPSKINIVPPKPVIKDYKKDYETMTNYMIYGVFLTFEKLIERISELQRRVNKLPSS